ncbi:sensor histidine kinase [Actinophytocola glycyrrhizae]|uniref:histidine kinase n=1 Tax=Actinophytocola glycyrrhizae TaxID=2044873 RepID=A0ABV9S8V2_9PSEU
MSRTRRERRMLLRNRITWATACVVAVAIATISTIAWFATQHNLRTQLDETLREGQPPPRTTPAPGPRRPDLTALCSPDPVNRDLRRFLEDIQLLGSDGTTCVPTGVEPVVIEPGDLDLDDVTLRDGHTSSGAPVRVLLRPLENGDVLVVSRSLTEIQGTLTGLRNVLIVVSVLAAALVGVAARLLTRSALAPLERLTETAEEIARTEDLQTPITVSGRDEAGRLGRAFAAMTAALSESRHRQRELVNDAAHELRTPLTSLLTNVDLLILSQSTGRPLPAGQQATILNRLQAQAHEFRDLVNELVILARDERELERTPVDIPTVIDNAARRAESRARGHRFDIDHTPWLVIGDKTALERTVLNLLDNAIKFSPADSTITVRSRPGWLTVTDEGPGIPATHRQHAFDRFWRAPDARALPGSGLGLAIVADTVIAHGGSVKFATPPATRGTSVRIELPAATDQGL